MACPKAVKGRHRRRVNRLLDRPATRAARRSKVLRKHLDRHGYITPNFAWSEMADTGGIPVPAHLHRNAIRHCWNLERFARRLGKADRRKPRRKRVAIVIDGPYRTPAHNRAVGGAQYSRHMQADATDHFRSQVDRWQRETGLSKTQIIRIAERCFTAVGNETSGTLHVDSRPGAKGSVRFVTWIGAR